MRLDLPVNVLRAGVWGSYRHLPLADGGAAQLQVEHAYVNTLTRGDLASLRWIESPLRHAADRPAAPGTDLCRVYYAPLNFRDIMLATGKLPPDALPGNLAGQECILGLEFSGRSSRGQRVMGMVAAQGLATTVLADEGFLWPVPPQWTLEQAATVPVAYATAYYALAVRGRMRRGEAVLVHAGTGGVGQAAIAIALHAGCTVFTTVGTPDKRAFLRERFPALPEENVGNSRDTSFEQLVLRRTRGRGVDLVLNSLAADKLQASVRCLAPGGRFLEIGKLDLSNDSPLVSRAPRAPRRPPGARSLTFAFLAGHVDLPEEHHVPRHPAGRAVRRRRRRRGEGGGGPLRVRGHRQRRRAPAARHRVRRPAARAGLPLHGHRQAHRQGAAARARRGARRRGGCRLGRAPRVRHPAHLHAPRAQLRARR